MEIPIGVLKNETQSLVNLVKNEASYLCCFNSYAREFEQRNDVLKAKLEDVSRTIDKARGASHVTSTALQWKREAEKIIAAVDTKKEKCLKNLCLNCWRQYRKGRGLAKQTLDIDKLLERCNFEILAGPTDLPGIKYHCLQNFMHFESRNAKLQDLRETLKGEENVTIGLHGLGGTGKTSMAKEVGAELEGSTFGKVIILVVSNSPDFRKLQREIARHLNLQLKDGEEELLQDRILKKISEIKERLLIVLDDVWEGFDVTKELGMPPRLMCKTCTILITTRNKDICTKMDCQKEIHIDALTNKEAWSLFLEHTNSASNLESLAPKIVKHCHGIPVVIVAVARSLKGQPPIVWKEALRNLQSGRSILNARGDYLKMAYEGLKLSYDNLRNEKAKKLFLISSLFPEDFEIPMEFLMGIGVGMGPFGEVDDYSERRRQVLDAIVVELSGSSLLLSAERQCVKMHDLVHEVALLIGEKELMQSLIESTMPVKRGLQCLFWKNTAFPKYVDGRNLEILLIFLVPCGLTDLEVPDKFFMDMKKLKVLLLQHQSYRQLSVPSLLSSIQSLQDIRTLNLASLKLCSISELENLPNLENLWLHNCSFIKSPEKSCRLVELRCLRVEGCGIKMSNPFALIEASPNLEEFTFLDNSYYDYDDTSSQKVSFHTLQIYQIYSYYSLSDYFQKYSSLSRCFVLDSSLMRLLSEKTFKELARTAEFLCLTGDEETEQKNIIPDIVVPVDDGGMTDLMILELRNWPDMHCLIDAMNHHSYVNAFSNLAEICLSHMGLSNILFDGNYNLCHLKTMTLTVCPKLTSIFLPSIAQNLSQLEHLEIQLCDALECIIASDNDKKSYSTLLPKLKTLQIDWCGNLEIILPMLPGGDNLERITIKRCQKLKYIFDKFQEANVMLPSLQEIELGFVPSLVGIFREYEKLISSPLQQPACTASRDNLKEIIPSTRKHSFSWAQVCCFKSRRATCEKINGAASVGRLTDEGITQVMEMCWKTLETLRLYDCKMEEIFDLTYMKTEKKGDELQPLTSNLQLVGLHNLSDLMNICVGPKHIICFRSLQSLCVSLCKKVKVLFSASVVRSLPMLEFLNISGCEELVNIVEEDHETNADEHLHHGPCFPELKYVSVINCNKLKYLFSITISDILPKLRELEIGEANELEHILIKRDEMEEMSMKSVLPQHIRLLFFNLPNLISVCHGINFEKEDYHYVRALDCPKFETSTTQHQAEPETENSQVEEKEEERLSSHRGEEITQQSLTKNDKEVSPRVINKIDSNSQKSSSKDKLVGKVLGNETTMIDPQQNLLKDELVDKEVKKETTVMEPKSQKNMIGYDIQSHEEEEEEEEKKDPKSENFEVDAKAEERLSSQIGETQQFPTKPTTLCKGVNDNNIEETNGIHQDESKANSSEHMSVDPSNFRQMEQEPSSSSRGQIEDRDVRKSSMNPALNVGLVQEIDEMMKLEGSKTSLLQEALKTRPQLRLPTNDRSTQMLCISYGVLIDILTILTTKTPFTITETDKRFLEDKLKDASLLGFDKDWLESIKSKVFNVSELNGIQEILKALHSEIENNKAMLAATRNQEAKAAQVVELAQKDFDSALQEHANIMANHTQLLKARQDMIARQNQCWEMIAAKNKNFGI